ncbi:MAG TPA: hypothetical protein PKG52_12640 [bacterium]|nr:hypothetical protein [bacterium]HPS31513.1 hypothetical protein [bacterium]
MKKAFVAIAFIWIIQSTSNIYAQEIKLGTYLSGTFTQFFPHYGFSVGVEMKYFYLSTGISSIFWPTIDFKGNNFFFYFDIGPRIPLYSGKVFQFSAPLAIRSTYLKFIKPVGDGYKDNLSILFLGGSVNLNFDWKIYKFGIYCFASAYFLGQVSDNSYYSNFNSSSKEKLCIGVQTGSGISYSF